MPTMNVPCARCAEFRERFQNAGYQVLGCDPVPADPGMCALRYQWPEDAAVMPLAAKPATEAAVATATAAAAPVPLALTATQAQTARAIVNIFETGSVLGDYGRVTVLPMDKGRLTYGRSQTSLSSGNLHALLQRYCANPGARFGARLRKLLPSFAEQADSLDHDARLHNLLRACADDRVMRETQDAFFDDAYWLPALAAARKMGLSSPLSVAVVYDSHVHGSWPTVRSLTVGAVGSPAQVGERAWVTAYVAKRREWLAGSSNPIVRATVYRMDAFNRLIDQAFWGLPLPLVVRDQEISFQALAGTPRGCYDGPQPGTRSIALAEPLPRGLDVRLVQLGLSDRGMDVMADGVFGKTSSIRVREYQIAHGLPVTGVADLALIAEMTA